MKPHISIMTRMLPTSKVAQQTIRCDVSRDFRLFSWCWSCCWVL